MSSVSYSEAVSESAIVLILKGSLLLGRLVSGLGESLSKGEDIPESASSCPMNNYLYFVLQIVH